ncbi:MAG: hypothetical protein AAGH38_03195, partial [Pseudomonadota bacterium]
MQIHGVTLIGFDDSFFDIGDARRTFELRLKRLGPILVILVGPTVEQESVAAHTPDKRKEYHDENPIVARLQKEIGSQKLCVKGRHREKTLKYSSEPVASMRGVFLRTTHCLIVLGLSCEKPNMRNL